MPQNTLSRLMCSTSYSRSGVTQFRIVWAVRTALEKPAVCSALKCQCPFKREAVIGCLTLFTQGVSSVGNTENPRKREIKQKYLFLCSACVSGLKEFLLSVWELFMSKKELKFEFNWCRKCKSYNSNVGIQQMKLLCGFCATVVLCKTREWVYKHTLHLLLFPERDRLLGYSFWRCASVYAHLLLVVCDSLEIYSRIERAHQWQTSRWII